MRILQLGKFYPLKGGVEMVMYALAKGLSMREIDCDALFANGNGHPEKIQLNDHCYLYQSKTLREVKATMISPAMIGMLRKMCHSYDIIHIHHPDPMAALALFLSGYKGKVVLHWHSDIIRQHQLLKFYRPLQSWLLRRADKIVGTSPVYIQKSPELRNVQNKTTYIPIGIPEPKVNEAETEQIKAQYPGKRIVFSLGRLVSYKGFEYLIEAAEQLGDDYIVLIGGKGNQDIYLRNLVAMKGLQERVKMLGYIPDNQIDAYYDACALFCLSSIDKREAFAIVQVQALAHGKPIVSVDIPESGVPWVNQHGVTGINVPPCDSKAIVRAIREVCADNVQYQRYGVNARKRYETLFQEEKMIDACEVLYKELLNKK